MFLSGQTLSDDAAFIAAHDAPTTYGQLIAARSHGVVAHSVHGRHLVLRAESSWFAAHVLAVSTDVAACITVLPPDLSDDHIDGLLDDLRPDVIVTDQPGGSAHIPTHPATSAGAWLEVGPRAVASPVDTTWKLATSGTSGPPKLVEQTTATLRRAVSTTRSEHAVWALTYPVVRFAGLQVFFQSLGSGSSLAIPPATSSIAEELNYFASAGCTHFSATPSFWRRALMSPAADRLDPAQITLGGEIADGATLRAIGDRWPRARVVHIFAATETGTLFTVTDGLPGFPAEFLERSQRGVELRISESGTLLARSVAETGADTSDFIDTGDRVKVRDGRVVFLGRLNGVINVGGHKVSPEEVESVILEVDGIVAVRVEGRPSPVLGNTIIARVQQAPGRATDADRIKSIRMHCTKRLERYKVPASVEFVDALPRTVTGKLERTP